jgi:serine protease Do
MDRSIPARPFRRLFASLAAALLLSLPAPAPGSEEQDRGIFCPACGAKNRSGSKFCARDGSPIPEFDPARFVPNFRRSPDTLSPEEVQATIHRASGSVVRIRVKTKAKIRYPDLVKDSELRFPVAVIQSAEGELRVSGSGFAVGNPGEIVTNAHVASPFGTPAELLVETREGAQHPARLVGLDQASDIALLRLEQGEVPALEWGNSEEMGVGDDTWAIGNPLDIGLSVSRGTISSLGRMLTGINQVEHFLHSDAFITHGNSGGPLVDVFGRVVGVSDMGWHELKGQGYSIPSNMARFVVDRIRAKGKYERGYLGIQIKPLPADAARAKGGARNGVQVVAVLAGTPAAAADVKPGDVLFGINGRSAMSTYHFQEAVSSVGPGADIVLTLEREGKVRDVNLKTTARPGEPRIDPVADLEERLMARFEMGPKGKDVVLRTRSSFSIAPKFGLIDGAIIDRVLPAQSWPEEGHVVLTHLRDKKKAVEISNLDDLRSALARAYLGGRIGVVFQLKSPPYAVFPVVFDETWAILL